MSGSSESVTVVTPTAVGSVGGRVRTTVDSARMAVFVAGFTGCAGSMLVPWAVTLPWLIVFCAVAFLASFTGWVRWDRRSVTRIELDLEREPRGVVLRGPWLARTYELGAVAAIHAWCDCGDGVFPELDPHLDILEVIVRDGRAVQVDLGRAIGPEIVLAWREWLEPLGVKVVDWRHG